MKRQRTFSQWIACGLACSLLWIGCGLSTDPAPTAAQAPTAGLLLATQQSDKVAGTLTQDGVTVRFSVSQGQDKAELTLLDGAGQVLVHAQRGVENTLTLPGFKVALPSGANQAATASAQSGDAQAAAVLNARPEMKLLPTLSRLLGERGINGRDYPASFSLHLLASQIAEQETAVAISSLPVDGDEEVLACQDLRSNPGKNDCYGMCGRGCSCWTWVCGDCCYHKGCAYHDTQCRTCSLTNPVACNLCYVNFAAAFAAGGGCAR